MKDPKKINYIDVHKSRLFKKIKPPTRNKRCPKCGRFYFQEDSAKKCLLYDKALARLQRKLREAKSPGMRATILDRIESVERLKRELKENDDKAGA